MRYLCLLIMMVHCLSGDVNAAPGVTDNSDLKVYTKSNNKRLPCIDIKINYPQIQGRIDKGLKKKINDYLKSHYFTRDYERSLKDYKDASPTCNKSDRWIFATQGLEVTALNRRLLSISVVYYSYDGGAHGFTYASVSSFDLKSGELLRLQDVLQGDYLAFIKKEFRKAAIKGDDNSNLEKISDGDLSFWIEQRQGKDEPKIHVFLSGNGIIELTSDSLSDYRFHRPQDVIVLPLSSIKNFINKKGPLGL